MKARVCINKITNLLIIIWVIAFSNQSLLYGASFNTTIPVIVDSDYEIEILVPGSYFHGIHGITFDSRDNLYVGSLIGQAIYHVDSITGDVKEYIGPPLGMADDLEFGPDGRIYYTSFSDGILRSKSADGKIFELADGLPGINSLAFNKEGRLFATQVFLGDALYEIDLSGNKKTKKIAENLGGLNGFDFGPDNKLYGPLFFKGSIVKVDIETGKIDIVAEGFKIPAAVNFDSKGNLYLVDTAVGEVIRVDINTGQKTLIAKVSPSIDNLAIDSKDRIFITNMSNNSIYEIDKITGKARTIVKGKFSCAAGVAVTKDTESETIYVADFFSFKKVDNFTGEVTTLQSSFAEGSHITYPITVSVHNNYVLLTSFSTGTVQIIDRRTNETLQTLNGFEAPSHAVMLDNESIIVAEIVTGNIVKVNNIEGTERTIIVKGLEYPVYLSLAENDAVYVSEALSGNILHIDLNNGEKKTIVSGLNMPEGIDVLPDGKLVVLESKTKQLSKIDPISGATYPLAINMAVGLTASKKSFPFGLITGVAVSKSGSIYVTGDVENVLYRIKQK